MPPGFTIASSPLPQLPREPSVPAPAPEQVEQPLHRMESRHRRHFGDGENPLLVSVRSGAARLDAGHDGHDPQPRPQRRDGGGARPGRAATPRSPGTRTAGSCRCTAAWCSTCPRRASSTIARGAPAALRASSATSTSRSTELQALVAEFKEHVARARPAGPSPTIRWTSSGAPSPRSSRAGTPAGRSTTGSCTTFPTAWAPRSTWWRWCSATWARTRAPASRSPAIPPPASARSTASTCSTRRARTWSSGAGRRSRSRRSRSAARPPTRSCERVARTLERHFRDVQDIEFTIERGTLYMLQTRRGPALGPRGGARSPARWWTRARSPRRRRSPASRPHDLEPAAAPHHRSAQPARPAHDRPPRLTRRRVRHGGVRRRPAREQLGAPARR